GGLRGSLEAALNDAFAHPEAAPAIPDTAAERDRLLEAVFVPALLDINEQNDQPLRRIAAESEVDERGKGIDERLVRARLLGRGTRAGKSGDETTLEVAHEALLRQWETLQRILDRRGSELKALQAVERAAHAWNQNRRATEWLDHKGQRLAEGAQLMA